MPELPSLRRGRRWIAIGAAATLLAGAIFDWTRPAQAQSSVRLYERAVIQPYRLLVRPMTRSFVRCRYIPTCSQYSLDAVQTHGFPRGLWLTIKRLCRCGPWVAPGTLDPIPPAHAS